MSGPEPGEATKDTLDKDPSLPGRASIPPEATETLTLRSKNAQPSFHN